MLAPDPGGFTYQLDGQRLADHAPNETAATGSDHLDRARRARRGQRRAGRPHPAAGRAVDASARQAGPRPRDRAARPDHQRRRARATTRRTTRSPRRRCGWSTSAGSTAASLPDGVIDHPERRQVAASASRSPPASRPTDVNLQYEVADATGDPTATSGATSRSRCRTCPTRSASVRVTEFGDRYLKLVVDRPASSTTRRSPSTTSR